MYSLTKLLSVTLGIPLYCSVNTKAFLKQSEVTAENWWEPEFSLEILICFHLFTHLGLFCFGQVGMAHLTFVFE